MAERLQRSRLHRGSQAIDLNYLYSQHQLSLMHAASATSPLERTRYLAAVDLLAYRIDNARRTQCDPMRRGTLTGSDETRASTATGRDL